MGGGGGQTKPAPENRFASGVLTGYLTGPQDLGDSKATEGAALFGPGGAGSAVGILPDWSNVTDLSDNTFFGNMTGPGANPMLTDAYGRVFDAPKITVGGGGGGGFGGGFGGAGQVGDIDLGQFGPDLIPGSSVANALGYLENTPSVFDQMSGGPIVNEINQRVNAEDQAYTTRAMEDLARSMEMGYANSQVTGDLISSSQVVDYENRLKEGVLNDLNAFRATRSLESTKYLGDLAMQDIVNQSNNMEAIITQALVEKGMKIDAATAIAIAEAANAKELAVASMKNSTDLGIAQGEIDARMAINSQNNALSMLGMGMDDYNQATNRQIGVLTKPLDLLAGQGGNGSIGNQPKSP